MKPYVRKIKKVGKYMKVLVSFPHIRVSLIILCISVISIMISFLLNVKGYAFASSIFANIFAGLITGFVICFIGGFKNLTSRKLMAKLDWLKEVNNMIKIYYLDYHRLVRIKFNRFTGDANLYDFYYDAHTHANDINTKILQSSFDERLHFNPLIYCKQKLDYDAEALIDVFENLHSNVEHIDVDCPSSQDIIRYFEDAHSNINRLNSNICADINKLEIEIAYLQRTLI